MGKVTKKDLARGTKLTFDHVVDPLTEIAADLSAANLSNNDGIISSQYSHPNGTFRLNFNIPPPRS